MNLQERYDATAPEFRAEIERLATQAGKTPIAVFALWREYSNRCEIYDQSALLPEFAQWYKKDLQPAQAARLQEFENKQADKVERLEQCAFNAKHRAYAAFDRADLSEGKSGIPFGQPILVGHHSERRHRRAIERADHAMRQGIEESEKADYYKHRAATAAEGYAIKSEDPAADTKLAARIAEAEAEQENMKASNAAIRKNAQAGPGAQIAALVALGHTEDQAAKLIQPDFCGRIGFPDYALTNNSANIRRMKQRLGRVAVAQATPTTETQGTNARLEDCPADNRIRLYFPGKPSEEVRTRLKSAGFRWSPTIGAWQAYRNYGAIETAKREAGI